MATKTPIRLPLGQFEFIEMTYDTEMTAEAAVEAFKQLQRAYKGGEGITEKEMDDIIQKMMLGVSVNGGTELWAKATNEQRTEINRIKRALKRIKAKNDKSNDKYEDKQGYSGQLDD